MLISQNKRCIGKNIMKSTRTILICLSWQYSKRCCRVAEFQSLDIRVKVVVIWANFDSFYTTLLHSDKSNICSCWLGEGIGPSRRNVFLKSCMYGCAGNVTRMMLRKRFIAHTMSHRELKQREVEIHCWGILSWLNWMINNWQMPLSWEKMHM